MYKIDDELQKAGLIITHRPKFLQVICYLGFLINLTRERLPNKAITNFI